MSPWEILGVDRQGADKRSVRRAYAILLRRHRPDEDPEGFTRVHQAYQNALAELATDSDAELAAAPRVELFRDASDEGLPAASEVMVEQAGPMAGAAAIASLDIDAALTELAAGQNAAAMSILTETLTHPGNAAVKRRFTQAIFADAVRFANVDAARFACRLASLIAFTTPKEAERLLNFAYENLPLTLRGGFEYKSLWVSAVGPLFKPAYMAKEHLAFWSGALAEPASVDWNSPEARDALKPLRRLRFQGCHEILADLLPVEQARKFNKPDTRYVGPDFSTRTLTGAPPKISVAQRRIRWFARMMTVLAVLLLSGVFLMVLGSVLAGVLAEQSPQRSPDKPAAVVYPAEEVVDSPAGPLRVVKTGETPDEMRFICYRETHVKRGTMPELAEWKTIRNADGAPKYRLQSLGFGNENGALMFDCFEVERVLDFSRSEYESWRRSLE